MSWRMPRSVARLRLSLDERPVTETINPDEKGRNPNGTEEDEQGNA